MDFKEEIEQIKELAKPIQEFLKKNYDLECKVIIDGYTTEIVRTETRVISDEYGGRE